MFIVINPDGELATLDAPADAAAIREAVGDFDLVRLHGEPAMFAFVNDNGFTLGLTRNPIGSCVIATVGARPGVYAGPIVVTGWEEPSDSSEIRDLSRDQVAFLYDIHRCVVRALDGDEVNDVGGEGWSEGVRRYAESVCTAPTPTLTFMPLGEYLNGRIR